MMKLKDLDFIRYSPMEKKMFELLIAQRGKPVTTEWLTNQIYRGRKRPFSSRATIIGVLRSLIKKAEHNKEAFKIIRTPAAGPHSIEVSIEP